MELVKKAMVVTYNLDSVWGIALLLSHPLLNAVAVTGCGPSVAITAIGSIIAYFLLPSSPSVYQYTAMVIKYTESFGGCFVVNVIYLLLHILSDKISFPSYNDKLA